MPKIISLAAPGGTVQIAVRGPGEAISAAGIVDDVVVKVDASLEKIFSMIASVGEAARESLSGSQIPPESAEIELGLQFTAKGNVYIVESQAAASIKVKLTYKFPK